MLREGIGRRDRLKPLSLPLPIQFFLLLVAGWVNRAQQDTIDYLKTELAICHELLGERRPRLTDAQRRRLAERANRLGRGALAELASIATPGTILRWYRQLVAKKYSAPRGSGGKPRTAESVVEALLRFAREVSTR